MLVGGGGGSDSHPDLTESWKLLGRDLELRVFGGEVAGLLVTEQTPLASS